MPIKKTIIVLAATAIYLGSTAPAHAQSTQTFTLVSPTGYGNGVSLSGDGNPNDEISTESGPYNATLDGKDITCFCVDLYHDINWGQSYQANTSFALTDAAGTLQNGYYQGGLASALQDGNYSPSNGGLTYQQRSQDVAYLIDNFGDPTANTFASGKSGSTNANTNLTAISLSIWDIVTDGGDGLTQGKVVTDANEVSQYGSMVNYYENLAATNAPAADLNVHWIQAQVGSDGSHYQDFAYVQPVPESGTAVGFGLLLVVGLGMLTIRRRQVKA